MSSIEESEVYQASATSSGLSPATSSGLSSAFSPATSSASSPASTTTVCLWLVDRSGRQVPRLDHPSKRAVLVVRSPAPFDEARQTSRD
ncbi:unnamed protein product [Boreogadus saida]